MVFSRLTANLNKQLSKVKNNYALQKQRALLQQQTRKNKGTPPVFYPTQDNLLNQLPIAPSHAIVLKAPQRTASDRRNAASRLFKGDWFTNINNILKTKKQNAARVFKWNKSRNVSRELKQIPEAPTGQIKSPYINNEFDNAQSTVPTWMPQK